MMPCSLILTLWCTIGSLTLYLEMEAADGHSPLLDTWIDIEDCLPEKLNESLDKVAYDIVDTCSDDGDFVCGGGRGRGTGRGRCTGRGQGSRDRGRGTSSSVDVAEGGAPPEIAPERAPAAEITSQ